MLSFIIGLILGIIQTYGFQQRTIDIYDGKPINVAGLNIMISAASWFSISFVSQHDYVGFIGFSLGCLLSTTLMAYRRKDKSEELNE